MHLNKNPIISASYGSTNTLSSAPLGSSTIPAAHNPPLSFGSLDLTNKQTNTASNRTPIQLRIYTDDEQLAVVALMEMHGSEGAEGSSAAL
jgi:hypothetical protein